jgi:hypothetical protein
MHVILVTQEAEIRRIKVQGQLRYIAHETLSQKHLTQTRTDGLTQVIEHLQGCRKKDPSYTAGGNVSTTTLENIMDAS